MSRVTIENPVINSPFEEPQRHFKFNARGITEEIAEGRRRSEYFMPFPKPKKQSGQAQLQFELPDRDLREANTFINTVRTRVAAWRNSGYPGVTPTTRRLLEHWNNPDNEPRLYFCQREAVETAIYLNEYDDKRRNDSFYSQLVKANEEANPDLFRIAFKMATGSGKTVVMAMLIAYHTLNKRASPNSTRFADAFLIVTPGVTIRDRLQVLYPEKPGNDYQKMSLVPRADYDPLCQAKIVITNYHTFQRRTKEKLSKVGKQVLGAGAENFRETLEEMVARVCRGLGRKKNIIVLNDEAHHCYRPKKNKKSASEEDEARLWINGIEAVKAKIGVKQVYDLSATPFFLSGQGYSTTTPSGKKLREGVLFPWVVSDFALIDSIELETFPPEYAEVYGVPFSFIPATGSGRTIDPQPVTEVKALPERKAACEITFPIVAGYRRQLSPNRLDAIFTEDSRYVLSTAEIPSRIEIEAITGGTQEVNLPYMRKFREQETAYYLANLVMKNHLRDDDNEAKWWLFPQVLRITRRWMKECVTYKDNMYPQYFQIGEIGRKAAFRIYQGILSTEQHNENSNSAEDNAPKVFLPFFRDKNRTGSTEDVEFETTQPTWETRPDKCHISHVVADTESWEQKTAQALEQMDEVIAYVKNHNLDFQIPYVNHNGTNRQYVPDFIARVRKPGGAPDDNILNLILETSGMGREDKNQKVNTVKNMWVPAVNNSGEFGEWTFLEIIDPWNIQNTIREFMSEYAS